MTSLEANVRRMSRNVLLSVTAASELAFTGCGTAYNECENGKDKDGKPCQVQYVHGSGYHYFPRSYAGPYDTTSPRIGPSAIPRGGGYVVGPRTIAPSVGVSRGGFGGTAHGFSGGG